MKEKYGIQQLVQEKLDILSLKTNELTQISSDTILQGPEALLFDEDGNLWITEHSGLALSRFDPVLETFEKLQFQIVNHCHLE